MCNVKVSEKSLLYIAVQNGMCCKVDWNIGGK